MPKEFLPKYPGNLNKFQASFKHWGHSAVERAHVGRENGVRSGGLMQGGAQTIVQVDQFQFRLRKLKSQNEMLQERLAHTNLS